MLASMGTTALAVAIALVGVPLLVWLAAFLRWRFRKSSKRPSGREVFNESFFVNVVLWLVLFAYQLAYGVPHKIEQAAASLSVPSDLRLPVPPSFAYDRRTGSGSKPPSRLDIPIRVVVVRDFQYIPARISDLLREGSYSGGEGYDALWHVAVKFQATNPAVVLVGPLTLRQRRPQY